jgi:hypothetical protein
VLRLLIITFWKALQVKSASLLTTGPSFPLLLRSYFPAFNKLPIRPENAFFKVFWTLFTVSFIEVVSLAAG